MKKFGGILAIIIGVVVLIMSAVVLLFGGAASAASGAEGLTPEQVKAAKDAASAATMYGLIATIGSIASLVLGIMSLSAKKKLIGILLIVISAATLFTNYVLAVSVIAGIFVVIGTKTEPTPQK
ncbi:hypothetical protein JXR93_09035 [bacterium]|nr:hypothetical protein [bacterium]